MKRKLKAASVKGTQQITKFFKKTPEIKANPLTARIPSIANSKVAANLRTPESNTKDIPTAKSKAIHKKKHQPSSGFGEKQFLLPNVLGGKNVNSKGLSKESELKEKATASPICAKVIPKKTINKECDIYNDECGIEHTECSNKKAELNNCNREKVHNHVEYEGSVCDSSSQTKGSNSSSISNNFTSKTELIDIPLHTTTKAETKSSLLTSGVSCQEPTQLFSSDNPFSAKEKKYTTTGTKNSSISSEPIANLSKETSEVTRENSFSADSVLCEKAKKSFLADNCSVKKEKDTSVTIDNANVIPDLIDNPPEQTTEVITTNTTIANSVSSSGTESFSNDTFFADDGKDKARTNGPENSDNIRCVPNILPKQTTEVARPNSSLTNGISCKEAVESAFPGSCSGEEEKDKSTSVAIEISNINYEQIKSLPERSTEITAKLTNSIVCEKTVESFTTDNCSIIEREYTSKKDVNMEDESESARSDNLSSESTESFDDETGNLKDIASDISIDKSKNLSDDGISTENQTGTEEDDEESSDDELFNPVTFLSDTRQRPDIRTPEKATTPLTGSPLTPISPFVAQAKDVAVRLKYSLDELLLEKPKQVEKDEALARLQRAMQETIERERKARMSDEVDTENEDEEKSLLPIHRKQLEEYRSTDKGFSDGIHGLNIFTGLGEPVKHASGCCQAFPDINMAEQDDFTRFLYQRSDLELREMLCCGWVTYRYLVKPCPRAVVQWLFHVLCYHVDNHTVKASYNALWSMLTAGDSKKNQELSWIPAVQDVVEVFSNYGANITLLLPKVCQAMDIGENLLRLTYGEDSAMENNQKQESVSFPLVNFTRLIQFMTLCVDRYPQSYSTKDIADLVVVLYCVSLDTRMEICQPDIKTCLQALYSAVEPDEWIEEATKMSFVIASIETHHRNKLRVVQLQPYSNRGRDVRRIGALQIVPSLLKSESISDIRTFIRSDFEMGKDNEILNTVEVLKKLEGLLHEVSLNDDTDYFQLYTVIELSDIVIGAEHLLPSEKIIVERITKKLRSLHSDIKDPRAMFISRTKVKDLILRTITKFAYMTQGNKKSKTQKTVEKFFVEGKTDLQIETLKDEENVEEDEEEIGSQASLASSLILGPLSQTTENSDDESLPAGSQELRWT